MQTKGGPRRKESKKHGLSHGQSSLLFPVLPVCNTPVAVYHKDTKAPDLSKLQSERNIRSMVDRRSNCYVSHIAPSIPDRGERRASQLAYTAMAAYGFARTSTCTSIPLYMFRLSLCEAWEEVFIPLAG